MRKYEVVEITIERDEKGHHFGEEFETVVCNSWKEALAQYRKFKAVDRAKYYGKHQANNQYEIYLQIVNYDEDDNYIEGSEKVIYSTTIDFNNKRVER